MNKPDQLELFKFKDQHFDKAKKTTYRSNFFDFIKIHEKATSILIVFFITALVSFSLGVEKGRRLSAQTKLKEPQGSVQTPVSLKEKTQAQSEISKDKNKYTIQVATFKTTTYAKKEAARIEKTGLKALIVPRGHHVSVCVGSFSKKQDARLILTKLKKTYHDCFLRRL